MERETPGQRPRPNYGHPQHMGQIRILRIEKEVSRNMTDKTAAELYEIGYQDGRYHQGNAAGQTTAQERASAAYRQGYEQGRKDRRTDLNSQGRKK